MARTYKRSSNGRFAGGGGTAGTGTRVSSKKKAPTAKQKARRKKILVGAAVGAGAVGAGAVVARNRKSSKTLRTLVKAAERAAKATAGERGYNPKLTKAYVKHAGSVAKVNQRAKLKKVTKAAYIKKRSAISAKSARKIRLHS